MLVAFSPMQIIRKITLLKWKRNTNANKSMRDGNNKKSHAYYSTRFCLSFECFGYLALSVFFFYRTGKMLLCWKWNKIDSQLFCIHGHLTNVMAQSFGLFKWEFVFSETSITTGNKLSSFSMSVSLTYEERVVLHVVKVANWTTTSGQWIRWYAS